MPAHLKWIAVLCLLALCFLLYTPFMVHAEGWDIDAMDKQITDTNMVVGAGGQGFCSGTVISIKNRLVLTADHCVRDQVKREEKEFVDPITGEVTKKTIETKLNLEVWQNNTKNYEVVSSRHYIAKIKARDSASDVALLQVIDEAYVAAAEAPLAPDSYNLKRGADIYVIGNPAGEQYDNSVTKGIVSNTERTLEFDTGKVKVFQIDAVAIGGNSGGSVTNNKGQLVGTLDAGLRGAGINFAVPISATKAMLKSAGFQDVLDVANGVTGRGRTETNTKIDQRSFDGETVFAPRKGDLLAPRHQTMREMLRSLLSDLMDGGTPELVRY